MSGQSTAETWMPEAAVAKVALVASDARPAAQYSIEEHDKALAELSRRAGPATEGVVERVNASFASYRAELNAAAGGQASSRVMLLAHNAQRAQLSVELQTSLSAVGHGQFAGGKDHDKKQEQVSKGLRNLVGLCAFAADLVNKAFAAACEEGRNKKAAVPATQQLFDAIGTSAEVVTRSPDQGGGVVAFEPPSAAFPNPSPGGAK